MKKPKKLIGEVEKRNKKEENEKAKIKYDVITPEERDPQPKAYDEIEY
ncbi:hypothetical protein AWH56_024210 [Anaerobacillus isosaccharinicus]|uniref:Uncharacterized protein n=1 Tax=Anaerobacillus isosaccharinicus TaxID=1532552 RepID=A0A7S7L7A9_9BACI|nr:hypothetical protein [Anaerobacillus isosaccharinicus]MBA5585992.1 hypothetical protein [Anaerobacillus isosaccharinicus]QOY35730.1 hypothetical protein AWH56_024210 [Anaerobacillus isosaccharinicus]